MNKVKEFAKFARPLSPGKFILGADGGRHWASKFLSAKCRAKKSRLDIAVSAGRIIINRLLFLHQEERSGTAERSAAFDAFPFSAILKPRIDGEIIGSRLLHLTVEVSVPRL